MLVFEDGVMLSEHYAVVHREKKQTKVAFGFNGDYSSEEERPRRKTHQ